MEDQKALQVKEPTYSERFTSAVVREFSSQVGALQISPYQKKLAQHLYIQIDTQLKNFELKRLDQNKGGLPITWQNVNMNKLAVDAVHRIELGLDALIPNHIYPIPYFNKRLNKYDLDLRIGYTGKDYYKQNLAIEKPLDVIYELVYSTDKFKPLKKSATNAVESYELEITNPFDRGEVVGGFGYIMYEDQRKNKLVIITKKDFDKARKYSRGGTFWTDHPEQMQMKTIVLRTTDHLTLDPEKINAAFAAVETQDTEIEVEEEIQAQANTGEVIDIEPEPVAPPEPEPVKAQQEPKQSQPDF